MEHDTPFSNSPLITKKSISRPSENTSLLGIPARRDGQYSRRKSSISYFYKHPQIISALVEASSISHRSLGSKLLVLTPAFAFQYCVVLTSVFSTVNLRLMSISPEHASVHLVVSAVISMALIAALQKCIQRWIGDRKHLTQLLICFTVYLSVGTLLVLIANVDRMSHLDARSINATERPTTSFPERVKVVDQGVLLNGSNLNRNVSADVPQESPAILLKVARSDPETVLATAVTSDNTTLTSTVPLYTQILVFVGYVIMASSFSSGQFLMSNIAADVAVGDKQNRFNTLDRVIAAFGGCCAAFLGALDLSSVWYPSNENAYTLIGQIIILLSIGVTLLIGCTACSIITWYSDVIAEACQPEEDIEENILIGHDRRPTRTAQEIFDECAALLGHRASISYMEENLSPKNLPTEHEESISNSIYQSDIIADDSVLHYSRLDVSKTDATNPPPIVNSSTGTRSCLSILKTQKFYLTLVSAFLLSSCVVSVEYSAAVNLGDLVHDSEDNLGNGYRKGTRIGSAGIFMIYLVFAAAKCFHESISQHLGWKYLSLGVALTSALLTLAFAVSNEIAVYFAAACVLGLVRLAAEGLPWAVSAGSQIPTTFLWCMTPLSLGVSSAVLSPLVGVSGFHGVAMCYSATCSLVGCIALFALF